MASAFASPSPFANSSAPSTKFEAQNGQELEEITTEALGFEAISGDKKLQLLPKPWPTDTLPPPTASLLSVASKKGLLAAAGPDSVILASTDSVRQGYDSPDSFAPQLSLNVGIRLSHLVFSADEEHLILSAENGGGLSIHETSSLLQGGTQAAFEIATNNCALRAIIPNPNSEFSEYLAVITKKGQLLLASLKTREFVKGAHGEILRENVSCASWSKRGKQIFAGLGDGTCVQLTPGGEVKAELPPPADLDGDHHVSLIDWLENELILIAYTLPLKDPDPMSSPTNYYIATKSKPPENKVLFKRLPEQAPPFGPPRHPAAQFTVRLGDFKPNLTDVLAIASSASSDISLVTRSKSALSSDVAADRAINVFTGTSPADDSRRATMPMSDGVDTAPIGISLDLSSNEKIKRPLPREEYEESPGPVPALLALNNQGVLATWWFVYAESIRQGTTYAGLTAVSGSSAQVPQTQQQASPFAAQSSDSKPFGASNFGQPSTPSFGSPSNLKPAFGAPSRLASKSPWGNATPNAPSAPAFGQSSFASPGASNASTQSAFGMTTGLGNRASPWGAANAGGAFGQQAKLGTTGSAFGQPSSTDASGASGPTHSATPASGGFASFANTKGFAAAGPTSGSAESIFTRSSGGAFSPTGSQNTPFGAPPRTEQTSSLFGQSSFNLGSTFKGEDGASPNRPKPATQPGPSLFGANFGASLNDTSAPQAKDSDMGEAEETTSQPISTNQDEKPTSSASIFPATGQQSTSTNLFGLNTQKQPSNGSGTRSTPGFSFGAKENAASLQQQEGDQAQNQPQQVIATSPKIKEEPQSEDDDISSLDEEESKPPEGYQHHDGHDDTADESAPETPVKDGSKSPEAPLPPESTSKTTYGAGDSSSSSKSSDDAPLPPDFVPQKSRLHEVEAVRDSRSPSARASAPDEDEREEGEIDLPPDDSLGEEGSGVDVAQDLSPASSRDSSKLTNESSFGHVVQKAPSSSFFSPGQSQATNQKSSLFGGIGKVPATIIPPPLPQESPRSPSPARLSPSSDMRSGAFRSISAPSPVPADARRISSVKETMRPSQSKESAKQVRQREQEMLIAQQQQSRVAESQPLSDDEDEQTRAILSTEPPPSLILEQFIAHQDYVGQVEKPGIPGQIEKVFRDINSMVDTLGLNARSLISFTKAHSDRSTADKRNVDDLEDLEWCLVESDDLRSIEDDLWEKLNADKLRDVVPKSGHVHDMKHEVSQLRRQAHDIKHTISSNVHENTAKAIAQKPLDLDQQTQLRDLRRTFKNFQKQLSDAEEGIMVLKAKLASCANGKATNGKAPIKQPTVEAVEHTIQKLTNIITEKSEDVARLTLDIQGLDLSSMVNDDFEDISKIESSKHENTTAFDASFGRSRNHGSHYTIEKKDHRPHLSSSVHKGSPIRRQATTNGALPDVTDFLTGEESNECKEGARRKQEVNGAVKNAFSNAPVRVRALD